MPRTKEAFKIMKEATRRKIEEAALSLFARKGLSVTIDEIAKKANISKGLLYSHYPSKKALILELLQQAAVLSSASVDEIAHNDDSAAVKIKRITAIMCKMLSNSHIGIEYFMFSIQVGMSDFKINDAELFTADMPRPIENLARIIYKGQKEGSVVDGDPLQLATVYWAAIQGLCCYVITGIPISPVPEALTRIVLNEREL